MTNDEILTEADEIKEKFKTSGRPFSTEEQKILDQAYEIRMTEADSPSFGYGGYPID